MAVDVTHVVAMLRDALLRELGDEVDLIFRYGSSLTGATHRYSDLDISYVPVHESTWHSITVLVGEVMVDLYPIHWSKLERMANFDEISSTVLLRTEIVYQRNAAAAARFRSLPEQLRTLLQPQARPEMIRKALAVFQGAGYRHFLLRLQAMQDHQLGSMQQARGILQAVLHTLALCNQRCIDTRKREQVLALPQLPAGFEGAVDRITRSTDPTELLEVCEALLYSTRELLLREQKEALRGKSGFAAVFGAAYPELKGDLQHIMLACERRDMFHFPLVSLYHELMIHTAQALSGVEYADFNGLADYEQDLAAMGFPALLPYVTAGDYAGLHGQCQIFDRKLQEFLTEREVPLYAFADEDELERYLDTREDGGVQTL